MSITVNFECKTDCVYKSEPIACQMDSYTKKGKCSLLITN